jgi:hypothetical protein
MGRQYFKRELNMAFPGCLAVVPLALQADYNASPMRNRWRYRAQR